MMDEPIDPGRRVLPRGDQPAARRRRRSRRAWRSAGATCPTAPATSPTSILYPGVHRRHDRLVVRLAPARGPALPHLVPAAARRHHAEPHRPGPHPRPDSIPNREKNWGVVHNVTENCDCGYGERRHHLPLAGRHGLRHGEVRQGGGHLGGRQGLGRDGRQVRRLDHRAGDHVPHVLRRAAAACATARASGWATASTRRASRSCACRRA